MSAAAAAAGVRAAWSADCAARDQSSLPRRELRQQGVGCLGLAALVQRARSSSGSNRLRSRPSGQRATARREQVPRRVHVVPVERPTTGRAEPLGRATRELEHASRRPGRARAGTARPARGGSRGSRPARRGTHVASSQSAKRSWSSARTAFGKRLVRRVPDQQVPEAKRVVAGDLRPIGPDELLAHERQQPSRDVVALRLRREGRDRAAVEDLPLDRAALDHGALLCAERVEPCLEERLDRRRHLDGVRPPPARGPPSPRGRADSPRPSPGSATRVAGSSSTPSSSRVDELGRVEVVERLEQDRGRVQLPARPARAARRAARAARCRGGRWARRATSRRRARRGRAAAARPSGGRRARARAGAPRPAAPAARASRAACRRATSGSPRPARRRAGRAPRPAAST